MKFAICLLLLTIALNNLAQQPVGVFTNHRDVGNPKHPGNTQYNENEQAYLLKGAGYNIWFNRDEFHYAYKKIGGDFILTANFAFSDTAGDAHKKIGWMVRASADEDAASMNAVVHADGLVALQWRALRGAFMRDPEDEIFFYKKSVVQTIQLERKGRKFIMRVANTGEPLQEVGYHDMPVLTDSVLAGIFISSHNAERVEEARIWNLRMDKPVPEDYHPNPQIQRTMTRNPLNVGCRLETVNVFDGKRKIIHESPTRFEAPNWMPDGKRLLFNEGGHLYTIPVAGGKPQQLSTGDIARNNNDHGISFDGKSLAISSHRQGLPGGGSTVYILPLNGGTPKQLTTETPSYWHGWNPNGKDVVIVGQRSGSKLYNIIRVDVNNGKETALTNLTSGHVDGPEYSPDGRYIYYNGNPTGTMQIWRMKADGTANEQITFDEYHNWFPHISPDGKWIAFISFPININPDDHPSYKQVMLRLMPASGGAPRVIAYLHGGQGTINVNSWSPDSKHLAFVSNSSPPPGL